MAVTTAEEKHSINLNITTEGPAAPSKKLSIESEAIREFINTTGDEERIKLLKRKDFQGFAITLEKTSKDGDQTRVKSENEAKRQEFENLQREVEKICKRLLSKNTKETEQEALIGLQWLVDRNPEHSFYILRDLAIHYAQAEDFEECRSILVEMSLHLPKDLRERVEKNRLGQIDDASKKELCAICKAMMAKKEQPLSPGLLEAMDNLNLLLDETERNKKKTAFDEFLSNPSKAQKTMLELLTEAFANEKLSTYLYKLDDKTTAQDFIRNFSWVTQQDFSDMRKILTKASSSLTTLSEKQVEFDTYSSKNQYYQDIVTKYKSSKSELDEFNVKFNEVHGNAMDLEAKNEIDWDDESTELYNKFVSFENCLIGIYNAMIKLPKEEKEKLLPPLEAVKKSSKDISKLLDNLENVDKESITKDLDLIKQKIEALQLDANFKTMVSGINELEQHSVSAELYSTVSQGLSKLLEKGNKKAKPVTVCDDIDMLLKEIQKKPVRNAAQIKFLEKLKIFISYPKNIVADKQPNKLTSQEFKSIRRLSSIAYMFNKIINEYFPDINVGNTPLSEIDELALEAKKYELRMDHMVRASNQYKAGDVLLALETRQHEGGEVWSKKNFSLRTLIDFIKNLLKGNVFKIQPFVTGEQSHATLLSGEGDELQQNEVFTVYGQTPLRFRNAVECSQLRPIFNNQFTDEGKDKIKLSEDALHEKYKEVLRKYLFENREHFSHLQSDGKKAADSPFKEYMLKAKSIIIIGYPLWALMAIGRFFTRSLVHVIKRKEIQERPKDQEITFCSEFVAKTIKAVQERFEKQLHDDLDKLIVDDKGKKILEGVKLLKDVIPEDLDVESIHPRKLEELLTHEGMYEKHKAADIVQKYVEIPD